MRGSHRGPFGVQTDGISVGRGLAFVHHRCVMMVVVVVMVAVMNHDGISTGGRREGGDADDGDAEGEKGLHSFRWFDELGLTFLILH